MSRPVRPVRRPVRPHRAGRWFWPAFAAPGIAWLAAWFVVPFYGVLAVAGGRTDPVFRQAIPQWNPLRWRADAYTTVLDDTFAGPLQGVFVRTVAYVAAAVALCILVGFPVAYHVARHGGKRKGLLLALVIAPFWVSYLMRMLAWVNILAEDGYLNRFLTWSHLAGEPIDFLGGRPATVVLGLVYGYVPFFVLPLYAALERLDVRLVEAARDLGATAAQAFWRVTLPLSRHGLAAGAVIVALPMFGDYYTNDLLSGSPRTEMIGNQVDLFVKGGTNQRLGAALVVELAVGLAVVMGWYLRSVLRASRAVRPA